MALNPIMVSREMSWSDLKRTEQKYIQDNFGRLWEVMAAGNLIPAKSFQARTVNFEYLPADKKELSLFADWLADSLDVPTTFNKSTLKLVVGTSSKVTVNFKEKKDPKEARKQTPTKIQEKGTTDVFNRVLEENEQYNSVEDMFKDAELMKTLRETFTKTHADKIDDWMKTYFSQQDLFFMKKFAPSNWSPFEYHKQDFVHFWSKFIKTVKDKKKPVGDYTTWNPSDIWAVKNKTAVNKAIDDAFKKDGTDPQLSTVNNLLRTLMDEKNPQLVGISLKKIEKEGAHMELINIDKRSMKLAEVIELKMSDIELQLDNIVQQEKVTTYIKFAGTHTMNINLGDKKKPGNLSFNTQIKGTAAQGGQAPVKLVEKLLTAKGSSKEFKNDHNQYPKKVDAFWDSAKDWEKKYNFVKQKSNSSSWDSWKDFESYLTDFYKDKKPQLAMTKLMQIDFYYDAFKNYSTDKDLSDFWIKLLHLGMKVGDRFAPHAKISE